MVNPDVIANPEESLFPGSAKSQTQRFGRIVNQICLKYKDIIESDFAFDIADIGVHSWRKCAHTKLNCGSTAGPSGAAACIHGGHSMGANKEKATDTYCGRILQILPEHSPEFAVSYPDFVPINTTKSVEDGVLETELVCRRVEVDREIDNVLESIFGMENLQANPTIRKLLRIGLASHLIHWDCYDAPVFPTDEHPILPTNSPLRCTPLFTNSLVNNLKEHVHIAMPWESHYKYFKPASGLPPHVMIYAYIRGLEEKVQNIPSKIEEILDKQQMTGPLSLDQIAKAVENGQRISGIHNQMAALTRMLENNQFTAGGSDRHSTTHATNARLVRQYGHPDGKYRRVPSDWKFPMLHLQPMYLYWHCGDESANIPPMKWFHANRC